MRNVISLGLLMLALARVSARADISDSGNLTIGGQATIVGTMTVQGSAFSVGGATFTVAGGSITLGGRLNAAAAGIKWADGTTSTTAAAGGNADAARLASTQTFSGANTFLDMKTVTYGNRGNSGVLINYDQTAYWMQSVDGATQSSGCVVLIAAPDGGAVDSVLTFTSSTTALDGAVPPGDRRMGVLLETCSPGSICKVGVSGFFRVRAGENLSSGQIVEFSATRCYAGAGGSFGVADYLARKLEVAVSNGEFFWMSLGH